MLLTIRDTSTVPPEDWAYEVVGNDTTPAFTVSTRNYSLLYNRVTDYCQANNLPIPSQQDVINQMCERLHIACVDNETHKPLINKFGLSFIPKRSTCCTPIPVAPVPESEI